MECGVIRTLWTQSELKVVNIGSWVNQVREEIVSAAQSGWQVRQATLSFLIRSVRFALPEFSQFFRSGQFHGNLPLAMFGAI